MNIFKTTLAGHILDIGAISNKKGEKLKKGKFPSKTKIDVFE